MKEAIFETKKGTYLLDLETGLFIRNNGPSTPKRFIGSVDPSIEIPSYRNFKLDNMPGIYRDQVYIVELLQGNAPGFTPEFVQGFRTLGIVCNVSDIVLVGKEKVRFTDEFLSRFSSGIGFELGSKIDRVYRQLTPEERGYRVE